MYIYIAPNRWKAAKEALVEADSSQEQVHDLFICIHKCIHIHRS